MTSEQLAAELQKKRRYQCNTCSKAFSRPSALRTHMYTHTGEKPFACTTPGCGRRFAVISNLRRHFKVHNKIAHTNKIPAGERLRHVQQLMERTARSMPSPSPHHPSLNYHDTFAIPEQHQHFPYQQQPQHLANNYYQEPITNNVNKQPPLSPLISSGRVTGAIGGQYHSDRPLNNHHSHNAYGPPLTPIPGNGNTATLSNPSYFKSLPPKVPFVVMSEAPQHRHHHHHPYYRELPFHHWDHSHQPPSFGQA